MGAVLGLLELDARLLVLCGPTSSARLACASAACVSTLPAERRRAVQAAQGVEEPELVEHGPLPVEAWRGEWPHEPSLPLDGRSSCFILM